MVVLKLYVPSASRPGEKSKVRVEFKNNPHDLGLLEGLARSNPDVRHELYPGPIAMILGARGKPDVEDLKRLQMISQIDISSVAQERLDELLGKLKPGERFELRRWFDRNHDSRLRMMERLLGADILLDAIIKEFRAWKREVRDIPPGGDQMHFGGCSPLGGERWQ